MIMYDLKIEISEYYNNICIEQTGDQQPDMILLGAEQAETVGKELIKLSKILMHKRITKRL